MAEWRARRPAGPFSGLGLGVIAAVVAADQASKAVAEAMLPFAQAIDLMPLVSLYRAHNTGIAFSLFAGSGAALIGLMVAVAAVVLVLWLRSRDGGWPAAVGFAFILGGAAGNLIDRVRLGYVVDFLLLHVGGWTLFVFNLADAALTLGPVLLLVAYLWPARRVV